MNQTNIFESIVEMLGKSQSKIMFDQMAQADTLQPKFTGAKLLAIGVATVIHSLTLILALIALFLIFRRYYIFTALIGGFVMLGVAWVLRPRFNQIQGKIFTPADLDHLNKFTQQIGDFLSVSNLNGFALDGEYNASHQLAGFPPKQYLNLGLPLWSVLTAQEKVALIAHELAHGANGDVARGTFIGTAINSLAQWHYLTMPDQIWDSKAGLMGLINILPNLFMLLFAKVAHLFAYLLSLLLFQDMQRAEYLADHLASKISGTEAMISLLQKSHLHRYFEGTARRISLNNIDVEQLFTELKTEMLNLTPKELKENFEALSNGSARLDVTHPPTSYRIQLLQTNKAYLPQAILSSADENSIDSELSKYEVQIARKIVDAYKASLYM